MQMKTLSFTILLMVGFALSAMAQSNLIVFTPEGEQFYLIINGIRQNEEPQTNVMVQGINGSAVKAKVIFADTELGEVDKNMYFDPAEPIEITYQVKYIEKKGEYVARIFGQVPIAQAPPIPPNTQVVVLNTTPMPPISTTITTTSSTRHVTPAGESINMNVGVNGVGMNVNVNVNDGTAGQTIYEETTVTTTTTGAPVPGPGPQDVDHYVMPGYNGPVGCSWPMSDGDFNSAKQSISTKTFEDDKTKVAKQIFNTNCMTSDQVRQIMGLFTYEDNKLEFAKYAYGRTFDIGNYYKVNDAFTYSSSIDELDEYINGGGGGW